MSKRNAGTPEWQALGGQPAKDVPLCPCKEPVLPHLALLHWGDIDRRETLFTASANRSTEGVRR